MLAQVKVRFSIIELTISGEERNGSAMSACTTSTTNAVNIIFRVIRVVIVQHVGNITNIFTKLIVSKTDGSESMWVIIQPMIA